MKKERLAGALKGIDILLEGTAISLENINSADPIEARHIEAVLVTAQSIPGLLALKEYYTAQYNDQLNIEGLLSKLGD